MVYRTDQLDQLNEGNYVCPPDESKIVSRYSRSERIQSENRAKNQRPGVAKIQAKDF